MRLALLLLGWAVSVSALAAPVRVDGVRVWEAPDNTRVVFDISGPADHALFQLEGPDRIVIDVANATIVDGLPAVGSANGLVRGLRTGVRNETDLRVVLDLAGAAKPKSFVLRPNDTYGHRLVIDLFPNSPRASATRVPAVPAPDALRNLVIAIDAGHGGEDPGSIGPSGAREKEVVLGIAKRLAALVDAEYGMQAVLIRDGDFYVDHGERIKRARDARADLFMSIHADAFTDPRPQGSSVYILSERGATSEYAKLLAERENAADLVGGVKLDDKDDMLRSVLLDLSMTGVIGASRTVGGALVGELQRVGRVHKREVQAANFLVLKAPDVPSVLVETAFISNPEEERKLRDPAHQQRIAQALMNGIRAYFVDHAPPSTLVAVNGVGGGKGRPHVIARGDTLSGIARRYNISVQQLRSINNIPSDQIQVGQVLNIPLTGG
jgi:N-acetylmuramoyl-L-alanine amidase